MTLRNDNVLEIRKTVVVFDIRSSTQIIEDLKQSDNLKLWRDIIISIKEHLHRKTKNNTFAPYKFLGDGWILLFEETVSGVELIQELSELEALYSRLFAGKLKSFLQREHKTGLVFGVDCGALISMVMNGLPEYIGRPINVAARLQSAVKDLSNAPEGKILMSAPFFAQNPLPNDQYEEKAISLRNILGGENVKAYQYSFKTSSK